eukprot:NODE_3417_length_981_cov_22.508584_g3139_i0.p1 GENE.NODE_3417_length_981_cov_22.508584_g3139_i0~~NODE_3417_length_981_cov_22.508584_g3139_i0.p1  ORF type:complete len:229 (+),score=75.15 NODE_3417_length_981_cov_22.508584_g3139_i0:102-788(+)
MAQPPVAPGTQESATEVLAVQKKLETLDEEFDAKVLELQSAYNTRRKPFYEERNRAIAKVPNFWHIVFSQHRVLEMFIQEFDAPIFKHLTALNVAEKEDVKSGYKISMTFSENPYFSNTELWKDYTNTDDGNATATQSGINWKEGMRPGGSLEPAGKKRAREDETFFTIFERDDADAIDIGSIIKDDVWPDPVKYFLGDVEDEDDIGEDDDDEDEDDEEEDDEDEEDC